MAQQIHIEQKLCTCGDNAEAHLHVDGGTIGAEALRKALDGYRRVSVVVEPPEPKFMAQAVRK